MEIKVRTKEQQAIDNLKAIVNSKDKIIEIEPPIEDTAQILLDIITNLEKELEDLREDNYAYHQLMKIQNKREYRSKFLKEFQEEFGTNTFPDYDEIYKRYDKIKKENERLKERCEYLQRSCERKEEQRDTARMEYMEQEDYKSRNEKAIEYVNTHKVSDTITFPLMKKEQERDVKNCFDYEFEQIYKKELLNILGGDDNENKNKN